MARTRQKIEQILKEWGKIDDQQIVEADKLAQGSRRRVEETLVELGYVDETDVAKALATQHDMEYIDLNQQNAIDPEAVALLPRDIVKKYLVLPVSKENGRLKVIIHDPMDLETLDNLRFRMNCEIETAIAARGKIKEYIDQMLSETRSSIDEAVRQMTVDARDTSLDIRTASIDQEGVDGADESDAQQAPIIRLVDHIITEAVRGRASDIHIEPFKDRVRLRYRVDGVC
ncbi:MAG: hypothetical protein QF735_09090, partial [Phycisphaeraceae bacterium]|nr:hypothetical protein [Phycisphaeraceae bacterium]